MKSFDQFVEEYKAGLIESDLYSAKNENSEDLIITVEKGNGFTVTTYQKNKWIRVNEYDKDGRMESETFEGKWE